MGAAQTAYATSMLAGYVGMIADMQLSNVISRTADGNIGFGQPVIRSGDHNCVLASLETLAAGAASANAGNTGNGAFGTITASSGAKEGTYRVNVTAAAANAGTFLVEDPDGNVVGIGTVGSAFSKNGIAFTLADGATDFVVGDGFTFAVAPTGGTADLDILGLSVADTSLVHTTADRYEQYDSVNVMDFGTMFVTAGATVAAGDPVYWIVASGKYTNVAGAGNLKIPNAWFENAGVDTGLVIVKLRKNGNAALV